MKDLLVIFIWQVINKNPDRETTGKRLKDVQEELDLLAEQEEALDAKLEARKKSFYVLIHSIQQLQVRIFSVLHAGINT